MWNVVYPSMYVGSNCKTEVHKKNKMKKKNVTLKEFFMGHPHGLFD